MPEESANYLVYYRNDVLSDGLDQIGTEETIAAIFKITAAWKAKGTGAYLEIGDISRAGGLDTSAHDTHEDGKEFDVRPLRNDGGYGTPLALDPETCENPKYHRINTANFIRLVSQLYSGSVFYFNDRYIYETTEFRGFVFPDPGHFDHLHIVLPGGARDKNEGRLEKENKGGWW